MDGLTLTIDLHEIQQFALALAQAPEIAADEMRRTMRVAVDTAEQAIVGETPVNFGNLRGSIATEIHGAGLDIRGEVFSPSVYALPVEHGRKPGKQPPVDAIELWVTRKLGLSGDDARSAAFLIARAIGRRGTQGAHMFEKGMNKAEPAILRLFDILPEHILDRIGGTL